MKKAFFFIFNIVLLILLVGCDFSIGNGSNTSTKIMSVDAPKVVCLGDTFNISVTGVEDYSITSIDQDIFEVNGLNITALKTGRGMIKVESGEESTKVTIDVINLFIESRVESINITLGQSFDLKQVLNAPTVIDYDISDASIIAINNGIITPLHEGSTEVTASITDHGITKAVTLSVIVGAQSSDAISTTSFDNEIMVGDHATIMMTSTKAGDQYTYTSSAPDVLSIDDGIYHALQEGTALITITSTITGAVWTKLVEVKYNWPTDTIQNEAVYLGIYNFGNVTNTNMASFKYRFMINGSEQTYTMSKVGNYELQNQLEEGNLYHLTISSGNITNLVKLDNQTPFSNPVISSVIKGYVQEINNYQVIINGTTYQLLQNSSSYKITKTPGEAKVASYNIKLGDYVMAPLTTNGYIHHIYQIPSIPNYELPIEGTPGQRTLTNFFKTALSAVGHALYVYGGAWNFEDDGSSMQARSIGVAKSWVEFFYENNQNYTYKNSSNHSQTYYPFGSFNEYYYSGVDCSGYVGWIIYNVLNTESGHEGYVMSSTKMAKNLAERGLGTYTKDYTAPTSATSNFLVGDIISTDGHVWICLGVCSDGSMVILHSTPSDSYAGNAGGGAQLGALGNSTSCEAYKLADKYNKTYYPDWSSRYPTALRSYSNYLKQSNSNTGKFSWYLNNNGVLDPDGLSNMTPEAILKFLFNEN